MRSMLVESASFAYSGTELHALVEARNYYRWVIREFAPFIGKRVIEVGAGIGTFSRSLLTHTALSELLLVEPGENLIPLLQKRFSGESRVKIVHGYFQDVISPGMADTVVLVNVLEHIAKDQALLDEAHRGLRPDGTLLLLVPALPWIYGSLDQAFGHYRRYTKASLGGSLRGAGFGIVRLSYINILGIAGWLLTGRVLRRKTLQSKYVRLYDRCIVPWLTRLEGRWEPPFGQSLIAIARKTAATQRTLPQISEALRAAGHPRLHV